MVAQQARQADSTGSLELWLSFSAGPQAGHTGRLTRGRRRLGRSCLTIGARRRLRGGGGGARGRRRAAWASEQMNYGDCLREGGQRLSIGQRGCEAARSCTLLGGGRAAIRSLQCALCGQRAECARGAALATRAYSAPLTVAGPLWPAARGPTCCPKLARLIETGAR